MSEVIGIANAIVAAISAAALEPGLVVERRWTGTVAREDLSGPHVLVVPFGRTADMASREGYSDDWRISLIVLLPFAGKPSLAGGDAFATLADAVEGVVRDGEQFGSGRLIAVETDDLFDTDAALGRGVYARQTTLTFRTL